jgi:hypothetical protein
VAEGAAVEVAEVGVMARVPLLCHEGYSHGCCGEVRVGQCRTCGPQIRCTCHRAL